MIQRRLWFCSPNAVLHMDPLPSLDWIYGCPCGTCRKAQMEIAPHIESLVAKGYYRDKEFVQEFNDYVMKLLK